MTRKIKRPNKEILEAMNEIETHRLGFKTEKWKKQNALAIKKFNERVKEIGVFSDKLRKF